MPASARVAAQADCATLTVGNFGELTAQQQVAGELAGNATDCITITADAGAYMVRVNQLTSGVYAWILRNSGGTAVCSSAATPRGAACNLAAAGTYTLQVTNRQATTRLGYEAAFVSLSGTQGCAEPIGTAWTLPAVNVTQTSPVQVFCQPFEAQAGQTVASLGSVLTKVIANATGSWLCQGVCVIPATGGPFRQLALSGATRMNGQVFTMEVRGVSDPVGCPEITPTRFGEAPSHPASVVQCRTFSVDRAGDYLVWAAAQPSGRITQYVHDSDGRRVCEVHQFEGSCALPRAGTYATFTLLSTARPDSYFVNVVPLDGAGCVPAGDRGAVTDAYRGLIETPTEIDCLQLPTEEGATVSFNDRLRDEAPTGSEVSPDVTVYDAAGRSICRGHDVCEMTGPAPYRAMLQAEDAVGTYRLAIQRFTGETGCPVLAAGSETTVTVSADRHSRCLTFITPRAGRQIVSWTNETGADIPFVRVHTPAGWETCANHQMESTITCQLPAAGTYFVMVKSNGVPATYRIERMPAAVPCLTSTSSSGNAPGGSPAGGKDEATPCVRPGGRR